MENIYTSKLHVVIWAFLLIYSVFVDMFASVWAFVLIQSMKRKLYPEVVEVSYDIINIILNKKRNKSNHLKKVCFDLYATYY